MVFWLSFLATLGCGSFNPDPPVEDSDTLPTVDTACAAEVDVTWQNWGKGFFLTYCSGCHAETALDRHGAPDAVVLDTLSEVRDWADRIDQRTLIDQDMPPGGGVLTQDQELLAVFLACAL